MKEIFLGILSAAVFLIIWLIGGNLFISIVCTAICFVITLFTLRAAEKEKKITIKAQSNEESYKKIHNSIIDSCNKLSEYIDKFKIMNTSRETIEGLSSIYKSSIRIAEELENDNSLWKQLDDFSSTYMKGLINVLKTYENLNSFNTDEAQKFNEQFLLFLNQINEAFEKKYYSLFSDDVLDSKAEMSAMMAIFKSEGLVDNKDFMGGLNK